MDIKIWPHPLLNTLEIKSRKISNCYEINQSIARYWRVWKNREKGIKREHDSIVR